MTAAPRRNHECRYGFALIEVLIAMAIFTIGFISIAAPLLVAVRMQSNTIDDVRVRQVTRSAESIVRGMGLAEAIVAVEMGQEHGPNFDTDGKLKNFPPAFMPTRQDRSYPSTDPVDDRRYYWTLKIRDNNTKTSTLPNPNLDFQVFLIVSRRPESAPPPEVKALAIMGVTARPSDVARTQFDLATNDNVSTGNRFDKVRTGDQILDEYGRIYRAVGVSASTISLDAPVPPVVPFGVDPALLYYVAPDSDTDPSPVRNIRQLPANVIQ